MAPEPLKPVKPTISANRKLIELTVDEMSRVAVAFAKSQVFKQGRDPLSAEALFVIILAGQELGLGPSQAVMGIKMIEGKPELSANTMAAMIKAGGKYDFRVEYGTDEDMWCEIAFFLVSDGESVGVSRFDTKMADDANLRENRGNAVSNYKKYWRNMFFARALSNGAKWYCADALRVSAYHEGEIEGDTMAPAPQIAEQPAQAQIQRPGVTIDASPETIERNKVPEHQPDAESEEEVTADEVDYFNPETEPGPVAVEPVQWMEGEGQEDSTTLAAASMFEPDDTVPEPQAPRVTNANNDAPINAAQLRLFHVRRKQAGLVNERDPQVKAILEAIAGVSHADRIPANKLNDVLLHFDHMKKGAQ